MMAKERDRLKVLHEVKKRHIIQEAGSGSWGCLDGLCSERTNNPMNVPRAADLGRSGGAVASSLLPVISKVASGLRHQGNFIWREPSGKIQPGPPGRNSTMPSGKRTVDKASFNTCQVIRVRTTRLSERSSPIGFSDLAFARSVGPIILGDLG